MVATLHDVALLAGVSIKTVSNVVNDYPHVRPSTRTKVEQAIAELGYTPNPTARSLRSGRTNVIGLAVPDLALAYFAELTAAVIAAAEASGLSVVVEQTGTGDRAREISVLTNARRKMTDGLIFSPLEMGPEDVDHLDVGYPLVLLGERIFDGPTDHVTMRNVEAARAATEYLIHSGRTRIAVVGAHEDEVIGSSALRMQGYREALAANGIPFDPALIGPSIEWHRANGAHSMADVIARGVPFDAVFALNDTLAFGAMRALQEAGLRIPDDVAVMGFDGLDEAQYSIPSLTTVDPGRDWIARTAVDTLRERVRIDNTQPPTLKLAEFTILERESAPPA
ncbi:LacI family DNA-binding transcriptional regulator [Microbacterium invictum]|uniref:DNA-binding LacI/PurR family transcriptional regulator n=1 Tax=Microbacterium invictum TaxID=515415 RepID=A0AA40SRZ5_9MICO|nr:MULTISPECIES: LacI family DNA-binding transcriptional regulator [Microbacterium]MBB4141147.1 DNA-binding LacI/PurR family transcriptional regulator [Microbacterium invictum]